MISLLCDEVDNGLHRTVMATSVPSTSTPWRRLDSIDNGRRRGMLRDVVFRGTIVTKWARGAGVASVASTFKGPA